MITYYSFILIMWIIIEIIILFLIIILISTMRINLPSTKITLKNKYFNPDSLRNGDIISVAYSGIKGNVINSICGNEWCHSGIVYVDDITKNKYILEGSRYEMNQKDFNKIPLSKWIKLNKYSKICIMKLNGTISSDQLLQKFKPFMNNSYLDGLSYKWIRFLRKTPFVKKINYKRAFTCNEALIRTLQEVGVFDTKYSESSYLLENILRRQIKCKNGFSYDEPYQICLGRPYVRGYIED